MRARLLDELDRPDETGVRWEPPERWHVTLRFLGEADEAAVASSLAELRAPVATAVAGPRVSRLGRHVVCLPVAGLDTVAAAVATATRHLGQPEERPFYGHLTLARLRHRAVCGAAGAAFSATFPVEQVLLFRSTLSPSGARHEVIDAVDLDER